MGFLAPAIPWIAKGASLLGGFLGGKKAQQAAQQRSPEEQAALGGANTAAGGLMKTGTTLTQMGLPGYNQSSNYWSTLLQGNRAAMSQATAAPRAALTDQYRGAERGLERSGLRGATRDLAKAELSRDSAGKVAGLTTGVQPLAASQLGDMSGRIIGQGTQAMSGAGNIYDSLLGQGFKNRTYARDQGQQAGSSIGGLIFDVLSGTWKKPNSGASSIYGGGNASDQGPAPWMAG